MKFIACDPGLGGALCYYEPKLGRMDVEPMPTFKVTQQGKKTNRQKIDEHALYDLIRKWADEGATHIYIEQVNGIPGQSAPAAFNFGAGYGAIRMAAIACGLAVEAVLPAEWKAVLHVPRDKKGARQRASQMIPTHRHLWAKAGDDGKAEAALLALYGYRHLNGGRFVKRTKKQEADIERANRLSRERIAKVAANKARRTAIHKSDDPALAESLF
jgi:crossover junction endodeoxyribonuclease RuvC